MAEKPTYRITHLLDENGSPVDIVEGEVTLGTMSWGTKIPLPPFAERPAISLTPFDKKDRPGPTPETANVTAEFVELIIGNSLSAHTWTWRARGRLLKPPSNGASNAPVSSPKEERKWLRGDKIGAWNFVVAILGVLVAIGAILAPFYEKQIRSWLHIAKDEPRSAILEKTPQAPPNTQGSHTATSDKTPEPQTVSTSKSQNPKPVTQIDLTGISTQDANFAARQARSAADDIQACLNNAITVSGYCIQQNLSKITWVRDYLHDRRIEFASLNQIVGELESRPSDVSLRQSAAALRQVADQLEIAQKPSN